MKRILSALGWAVLFAAYGAIAFIGAAIWIATPHELPHKLLIFMGTAGAAEAMVPWCFCLCFALLPGVLPTIRPPNPIGFLESVGILFGASVILVVAGALPMLLPLNLSLFVGLHTGRLNLLYFAAPFSLQSAVLAGDLTLALWLSWLLRRIGPVQSQNGGPSGIGWCATSWHAYGLAIILAVVLVALVTLLFWILPPNHARLEAMDATKLFHGPAWAIGAVLVVIFILAPVVEEILFRGLFFAGAAAKWGATWATILSSLIFVIVHAPEKIYYLPGFLDVSLLAFAACWLRLRCRSIRPGVLLHMCYNIGLLVAVAPPH